MHGRARGARQSAEFETVPVARGTPSTCSIAGDSPSSIRTRVCIARIFDTYGPRMRLDDGRLVPTFVRQALAGEPLTIHGEGTQTRSFCYIDDLIEGLWLLIHRGPNEPVSPGNDEEMTVADLAAVVVQVTGRPYGVRNIDRPVDDPGKRRPSLASASGLLAGARSPR